jgi:hypothetical protein
VAKWSALSLEETLTQRNSPRFSMGKYLSRRLPIGQMPPNKSLEPTRLSRILEKSVSALVCLGSRWASLRKPPGGSARAPLGIFTDYELEIYVGR